MRYSLLLFISVLISGIAYAQYDTTAPYLKTRQLPDFRLLTVDSVEFDQRVLNENKSTIIMLFNPECDHCQQQLDLLLSMPLVMQQSQIILSSNETQVKNSIFFNKNHLEKYPSIHLGKDFKYFFGTYFQPKTIPVLAFYNPKKQLVFFNQGNVKKKQVEQALKPE